MAAGRAAGGDFAGAMAAEQLARERAKVLRWDLGAIEARLAGYAAGRPCTGDLVVERARALEVCSAQPPEPP